MTYHSIIRTEQRAKVNEEAAIRMINRAKARGKKANSFPAMERNYLRQKETKGMHVLYYSGFCFVFNEKFNCVTMFHVPTWFGKTMHYCGKEKIQYPKKYIRNNMEKVYLSNI